MVELNFDILKTIYSLQAELRSLREDILNERNEQQAINKALLRNMMGGSPQGKPTQSTNSSKREPYHKRASITEEGQKEERMPKAPKGDNHSPSSDDSLSPRRKKQRINDSL